MPINLIPVFFYTFRSMLRLNLRMEMVIQFLRSSIYPNGEVCTIDSRDLESKNVTNRHIKQEGRPSSFFFSTGFLQN